MRMGALRYRPRREEESTTGLEHNCVQSQITLLSVKDQLASTKGNRLRPSFSGRLTGRTSGGLVADAACGKLVRFRAQSKAGLPESWTYQEVFSIQTSSIQKAIRNTAFRSSTSELSDVGVDHATVDGVLCFELPLPNRVSAAATEYSATPCAGTEL